MKINPIGHLVKTNPIQTQSNPISEMPKMNVSIYYTIEYSKKPPSGEYKTNPIQTQSNPILKGMNLTFVLQDIMRVNPHSQRIIQSSILLLPGVLVRESPRQKDKIALKIYPFDIDYPIVLKELKLTDSLYVIPAKAGIQ